MNGYYVVGVIAIPYYDKKKTIIAIVSKDDESYHVFIGYFPQYTCQEFTK